MQYLVDAVFEAMKGMIVAWYGAKEDIPEGWHACDGTDGTPNLVGRYIMGPAPGYDPGDLFGNFDHAHGTGNHQHSVSRSRNAASGATRYSVMSSTTYGGSGETETVNHLPKSCAFWWIIKM